MKNGQMSSIDMILSLAIIIGLIAITLVIVMKSLSHAASNAEIDEQLAFRTLVEEIDKNSTIDFLDHSKINLTAFHSFGIISESNMTRFMGFFSEGNYFAPDICMFLMNSSHQYINVSGTRYAYGNVSNNPDYGSSNLLSCQNLLDSGLSPCFFYRDSEVYKKAVYLNMTYVDLYIVYCKT